MGSGSVLGDAEGQNQVLADFGIGRLFWLTKEAIVIADVFADRILLINPAAARLFGYSEEEARGLALHKLVPEEMRPQHFKGLDRYRESGTGPLLEASEAIEVPALRANGQRIHVELQLTPVDQATAPSRHVIATIRDVTPRKEFENQLRSANERLMELDELREEFLTVVSHDIRSPLAASTGYLELLRRMWERTAEEQRLDMIVRAERSLHKVTDLAEGLLDTLRIDAGYFDFESHELLLQDVIAEAVDDLDELGAGERITLEVPEDLAPVWANRNAQKRILTNLLSNALKYSAARARVRVLVKTQGDNVAVAVSDSGIGISRENQSRLFEKFRRFSDPLVDGGGRSTGVGLYITSRLVAGQGGEIDVQSTPGEGSVFSYTIPVAPPQNP